MQHEPEGLGCFAARPHETDYLRSHPQIQLSHCGAPPSDGEPAIHRLRSVVMDSGLAAPDLGFTRPLPLRLGGDAHIGSPVCGGARNDGAHDSNFKNNQPAFKEIGDGRPE